MSSDNVSEEKVRITFTKNNVAGIGQITRNEKGLLISRRPKSENDTSSTGDKSQFSFVIEQEEGLHHIKLGKLTVSKRRDTLISNKDKKLSTVSTKTADDVLKELIVKSILTEILSTVGDGLSTASSFTKRTSSRISTRFSKTGKHVACSLMETPKKAGLLVSHKQQENDTDEREKRRLTSIVRELELPISTSLSSTKPHVTSQPEFDQLIQDTHITTSSTILAKPGVHRGDSSSSISSRSTLPRVDAEDIQKISSPFDLCWCFGFNPEVAVINLSNDDSSQILFANSQYAVIYDFHEDSMSFLQGHLNTVNCMATNPSGSLVVTADSGSEAGTSRVIVWDRRPCVRQVLENVHPHGCEQVGLSPKGDFIVTVSSIEKPICIKVWEWERDNKTPSASAFVKESLGNVKKLTVHTHSNRDFAVTFERCVLFARLVWQTVFFESSTEGRVSEKIKECDIEISSFIPSKLGSLTDTTYLESDETVALSSTNKGYVVIWEDGLNSKHKKVYSKYVRLHLDCITNIQTVDDKIAVATAFGNISFYDFDLKILFVHKLNRESLVSLSFNLTVQGQSLTTCETHPSCANTWRNEPRKLVDASLKNEPFSVRHFVVSTESGRIAYVNASCGTPKYLLFPSQDYFTALDILPDGKFLCAGTANGKCLLFDTDQRRIKIIHQLKIQANSCQAISVLKYSPSGFKLFCGMYTGEIWSLDPLLLTPNTESPLTECDCCITKLNFTPDSEYLIVTDVSFCISVYSLREKPTLIGQYIAHSKPIVSVVVEYSDTRDGLFKVHTISADRTVCQFFIDKEKDSFDFVHNQRVEQAAVPLYSVYYPSPYSSAGLYLGVSDEYKFRLHDPFPNQVMHRSAVRRCRGTILAPDFGLPINYMIFFENNNKTYLFFKTDRHIGIHLLPIDGNPFRALGFRASPTNIIHCAIHPSGKYVFTISENCSGISMWKINIQSVKEFYVSGGEGLEPFLRMLGEEKEREIRDFFDLGQFLHQGENPNLVRTLTNTLPICEVANVLLALGCLLTKHETSQMINELIMINHDNPSYNVDYDEFVRLYLNYRKKKDLTVDDLRKAFTDFYAGMYYSNDGSPAALQKTDSDPVFDSSSFIQKLLVTGEEMTMDELYTYFSVLTGGQPGPPDDEPLILQVPPTMPKEISFKTFVKDILGFPVDETLFEKNVDGRPSNLPRTNNS